MEARSGPGSTALVPYTPRTVGRGTVAAGAGLAALGGLGYYAYRNRPGASPVGPSRVGVPADPDRIGRIRAMLNRAPGGPVAAAAGLGAAGVGAYALTR